MHAKRVDSTHAAIRDALRATYGKDAVLDTHAMGDDFPDLVLGAGGLTLLIECKTPTNKAGGYRADKAAAQLRRAAAWHGGPWLFVVSPEQALALVAQVLNYANA
jgi:Holliday junction resolvase